MTPSQVDQPASAEPTPIRLRITGDGRVQGLWTDAVDFAALGPVSVRRASHVEFNERRQCWEVRAARPAGIRNRFWRIVLRGSGRRVLFQSPRREEALAWESSYFGPGGEGWAERPEVPPRHSLFSAAARNPQDNESSTVIGVASLKSRKPA